MVSIQNTTRAYVEQQKGEPETLEKSSFG